MSSRLLNAALTTFMTVGFLAAWTVRLRGERDVQLSERGSGRESPSAPVRPASLIGKEAENGKSEHHQGVGRRGPANRGATSIPRAGAPGSPELPQRNRKADTPRLQLDEGWRTFLDAVRQVETGGSASADKAIGDGGRSRGPYQIGGAYWADACAQGKVQWDYHTLVGSEPHCRQVMMWYWRRYCPRAVAERSWQTLARTHNGGPIGHRRAATAAYWRRVDAAMAKQVIFDK